MIDLKSRYFQKNIPVLLIAAVLLAPLFPILPSSGTDVRVRVDEPDIILHTHKGELSIGDIESSFSDFGSTDHGDYLIIQFNGPIKEYMTGTLRSLGFKVHDYLPDFAFVVSSDGADHTVLDQIGFINGWTEFPSEMKISPILFDALEKGIIEDHDELIIETFRHTPATFNKLRIHSSGVEEVSDTMYEVKLPISSLEDIARIPDIKWVEPKAEMVLFNDEADDILDVTPIRTVYGLDGTGQIVGIGDSGIDTGVDNHSVDGDMHLDFDNRVIVRDWVGDGPEDLNGHGTHVSGSVAGSGARSGGNIQGMAPNASIVFQALGPGSQNSIISPSNLSQLFKQAYDLGARIHTNSWGSSGSTWWGRYTTNSYRADWTQFYYPDMLILFAAGNEGSDSSSPFGKIDPGQVSPPATAKSIVSVGASENDRPGFPVTWASFIAASNPISSDRVADDPNGLAGFSSRGPTDDDRIKPDVVAPGTFILSTKSSVGGGGWASYDQYYHYNGGTSMSTPITTGTATLIRQFYNDTMGLDYPLNSLIKATLINGAVDLSPGQYGTGPTQEINSRPDIDQGWGRVNLKGSIYPDTGNFDFENNVDGLRTGENFTKVFRVNSAEELRVTLAWSDFPGSLFAGKYLVNDLDLILRAPDGTVYHGNDLTAPFDDTTDDLNPVEGVTIPSPAIGWWEIEVNASNVPRGPQHFAVVLSGNTTDMISNSMLFDKPFYSTDNGLVTLRLTVSSLIGKGTIDVNLTSTTDPIGRMVTLLEEGDYGSFVGTIRTSNTTTSDLGKIHVEPEDTLYAMFLNDGSGSLYEATATAQRPQRVSLWHLPENHVVYSEGDLINLKGKGTPGATAFWSVPGSILEWRELHDDGDITYGDVSPNDGNYSERFVVPDGTFVSGTIVVRVIDPFLGEINYPQFQLEINSSMPRTPRELMAEPLPQGNSIGLSWKRSSEPDMERHAVFINATPLNLTYEMDDWEHLFNTSDRANNTEVYGLIDGVEYYFRVATINTSGVMSSLSPWVLGLPEDTLAPTIDTDMSPFVIAGEKELMFTADDDLELLELEYYNDTDGNGLADDGNLWMFAGNSTQPEITWDTREEAGGPGNLRSMILRARGTDEVENTGNWREFPGFSVDNIGPLELYLDTYPARISNIKSYTNLLGYTEPLSRVEYYINGDLQNTSLAGMNGLFAIDLELEEGYNLVNLTAYDNHGAGPVYRSYEFSVDTLRPSAMILDPGEVIEIDPDGVFFESNSTDIGLDQEFARIVNSTWEIVLPTGEVRRGFGVGFHYDMDYLGNHALTLTVRDMAGNTNSTTVAFIIDDTIAPVPAVFGDLIVNEDSTVRFSSFGSTDNDPLLIESRETAYNWTFSRSDGWNYTSERNETVVIFPDPGVYEGLLRVIDRSGNEGNLTFTIEVLDISPPLGYISAATVAYIGELNFINATFTDNDMSKFDGANYHWEVYFIDDYGKSFFIGNYNGSDLQLTFDDVGNYSLTVNVTDPGGNWAIEDHRIWIRDLPMVLEDEGLTPDERSWTLMIIIGAVMVLVLIGALIFIRQMTKEDISDVDWADDDEDIVDEDEELEELDDFDDEDDWEWDDE